MQRDKRHVGIKRPNLKAPKLKENELLYIQAMWFNQLDPTVDRVGDRIRVVFPARSGLAAFAYLVMGVVVAAPFALNGGWMFALPLGSLFLWPAACAVMNVVTVELTPHETRASYGPIPWLRSRVKLGRLARLRTEYEVELTTHSNTQRQMGAASTSTSTRRVPVLKLSDTSGKSAQIGLGPPRAGVSAINNLGDISAQLTEELGLEAIAEKARKARLEAKRSTPASAVVVGHCPRDGSRLVAGDDLAGGLVCPSCGGRTIDAVQSRQALEQTLGMSEADLRELGGMFNAEQLGCPGCGEPTEAIRIKGDTLNHCFACRTTWLDRDEVEPFKRLIEAANAQGEGDA